MKALSRARNSRVAQVAWEVSQPRSEGEAADAEDANLSGWGEKNTGCLGMKAGGMEVGRRQ